jgi:uncharacterized protein (TIGR02145 family)
MKKILIILVLMGTVQIIKAQTDSIIITKKNNGGIITRPIDLRGYSTIWNFNKASQGWLRITSTGWVSTINYTVLNPCPGTPTVIYAGQIYTTVQIGNQCWLAENLNVGTMVDTLQDQTDNGVIEKYCYQDDPANCAIYGGSYQWGEALQYQNGASDSSSPNPAFSGHVQGICPGGWHIPTRAEFDTLLHKENLSGNALKAIGQGLANGKGTNTSGFSALMGGFRQWTGAWHGFGYDPQFWTISEVAPTQGYFLWLSYNTVDTFTLDGWHKSAGMSIRCVKD